MSTTPGTGTVTDLGTAVFTSPVARRKLNARRKTMTSAQVKAIALANELAGETGVQLSAPLPTARTLFGLQGSNPVGQVPPSPGVAPPPGLPPNMARSINIDGRNMSMSTTPVNKDTFTPARLWDKTERHKLDPEQRQIFVKSATGYVLSKTNKLNLLSLKEDDEGVLKHVHNLRAQLQALEEHAIKHDIVDVFTIVSVDDVTNTGAINTNLDGGPLVYNLFQDYVRVHKAEVATSNAWYHTWLSEDQSYVKENMAYTLDLLQSNTDEKLWSKCKEEYDDFHPIQQGGPLMLSLLLKKIQHSSESALEHLRSKVTTLKISKLEGENVDHAVSLIRAAYNALLGASYAGHSYVPEDFPLAVLKVMQTSSNAVFNETFSNEVKQAQREADKYGGIPEYSSVTETLNQASTVYNRMVLEETWDVAKKPRASAFVAPVTTTPSATAVSRPLRPNLKCFNCEKEGCSVRSCPEPRDDAKIQRNRRAFMEAKGTPTSRTDKPPFKIARDGSRLVLNNRGLYVHEKLKDVKAGSTSQKATKKEKKLVSRLTTQVQSLLASMSPTTPSVAVAPPAAAVPPTTPTTTANDAHRSQIRSALLAALRG